ncbi:MAG: hypothetical protein ACAH21_09965, partial [Ramlibacter sp.]
MATTVKVTLEPLADESSVDEAKISTAAGVTTAVDVLDPPPDTAPGLPPPPPQAVISAANSKPHRILKYCVMALRSSFVVALGRKVLAC